MNPASGRASQPPNRIRPLVITLLTGLLVMLLAAVGYYWLTHYRRVTYSAEMPPVGIAAANPLYALQKTLQQRYPRVQYHSVLNERNVPLQRADTLIFRGDVLLLSPQQQQDLLAWVKTGGRLIIPVPASLDNWTDAENSSHSASIEEIDAKQAAEATSPFMQQLQLRATSDVSCVNLINPPEAVRRLREVHDRIRPKPLPDQFGIDEQIGVLCNRFMIDDPNVLPERVWAETLTYKTQQDDEEKRTIAQRLTAIMPVTAAEWQAWRNRISEHSGNDQPEVLQSDGKLFDITRVTSLIYARWPWGKGRIDLISDLDFMTDDKLEQPAARWLASEVLEPLNPAGTIYLVDQPDVPSLWLVIWQRWWPVWLPLLILTLAGLWQRSQRFGPWQPSPIPHRRSLVEHLQAAGEHLWRFRQQATLSTALRQRVMRRLEQLEPALVALAGQDEPAFLAALAARTQLDIQQVTAAWQPRPRRSSRQQIQTTAILLLIWQRLRTSTMTTSGS